jgi:hypothetical protein
MAVLLAYVLHIYYNFIIGLEYMQSHVRNLL